MNVPWYCISTYRLPSTHLFSDVPVDTCGGWVGSIHIETFASQVPTIASSFWWASPGVAAFCIASMAALASGGAGAAFLSCAAAEEAAATTRPVQRARLNPHFP